MKACGQSFKRSPLSLSTDPPTHRVTAESRGGLYSGYTAPVLADWTTVSLSRAVKHRFDDDVGAPSLAECHGMEPTKGTLDYRMLISDANI